MKLKMNCSIVRLFGLFDSARLMRSAITAALVTMGLTAYAAEPEAVQLWEGGPYWATSNLGEPEAGYEDHPEYGAIYTFEKADAVEKEILGPEWRLPTKADFERLISDCEWVWDASRNGILFTGKGVYASNSIFLPAAGWDTGGFRRSTVEYGLYWSSNETAWDDYAWSFVANADGPGVYDHRRDFRLSIRAVRDTPPPKVMVDGVTPSEQWCKIKVDYTVIGKDDKNDYAIVFEVTAGGLTASEMTSPGKLTNGAATKVVDTEKLFGRQIRDENAKVKVSLMKVVGARRLWEGGPYWAECNVGANRPGDCGDCFGYYDAKTLVRAPWRMPEKSEFEALLNTCTREWVSSPNSEGVQVQGYRFTGKGEFLLHSIFLPTAVLGKPDQEGYYWFRETEKFLYFNSYWAALFDSTGWASRFSSSPPYDRMSVRAVRDVPQFETADAFEKPFQLGALTPLEYVDANGTLQSRPVDGYELLTEHTATINGGRWYAVTGSVSRGTITVNGSANIVLCDGAKLTVSGTGPGVRVDHGNALTIYGQTRSTGELVATGGANCAGIGGGNSVTCGEVTVNGGKVAATGGISGGWNPYGYSDYTGGAGIGGGHWGSGGSVTINGGTVTATGAADGAGIGAGSRAEGGAVTINGGNVVASSLGTAPKNSAGEPLHKVTFNAPNVVSPVFGRLADYGLQGVFPVDGKFCFYLPDGGYQVSLGTVTDLYGYYCFIVSGRDVVCNLQQLGLAVNGLDVTKGSGSGWTYSNRILRLDNSEVPYVLSGISAYGDVQVRAASDCTVDLSDAIIYTEGRPAFVVDDGVTATLRMKGGVSHLAATNGVDGASVPAIEVKGTLNVDFAPGADPLQSEIYAFNFGDQPAIGGSGEVSVVGGHLCVWSDHKAIGADCNFHLAESSYGKAIGQVGDDWDDVRLVGSGYLHESKFYECSKVELAQVYWVSVPAAIEHIRAITVSNNWEELRYESEGVDGASTNRYCAMLNDTVTVNFEVEDGYVLVSANPQVIPLLTNDVVVLPDVRRSLTVTLPETLEGETYVVKEAGIEVEKIGGGGDSGVAVYPVLSGYDIEIVCTAQEDWRIVSETNVVRFAAIDESKTLAAADLPEAWRLFTVTVPTVEHAVCDVTSSDGGMARTGNGEWTILSNAEVAVTFSADENYLIAANGAKTWTLTGDVTFGTTEGFPLPTLEGILGTVAAPWPVGENVQAYTNGAGVLTITGTGAMNDFASVADVPWDPATVTTVVFGEGVTKVGANGFAGFAENVPVQGLTATVLNNSIPAPAQPAGAISPAEFERIDIVDGVAYLGVSVYTNSEVKVIGEGEGWGVATNGVIEVPAPGKKGFFYLMSRSIGKENQTE